MKRILFLTLSAALILLLFSGCADNAPVETAFTAMDTYVSVRYWGDEALLERVSTTIETLDGLLSVTDERSEIFCLNADGSTSLSAHTKTILEEALRLSERTGGAFDPTVYPMVRAWGFTEKAYQVPDAATLAGLVVGAAHLHISDSEASLDAGAGVDLGAIAKGYASECCAQLLREQGVQAAILVLGGNVQTIGTKPDGSEWLVGISNPDAPSEAIAKLRFTGAMALVTSGDYQRYFEADGVRYHHIIDPASGYPAETDLRSVTILSDNATEADALSTALFVMGSEKALEFWRQSADFEAVLICRDGTILATQGAAPLLFDCTFSQVNR